MPIQIFHPNGARVHEDGTVELDQDLLDVIDMLTHPAITDVSCDETLTRRVFGAVELLWDRLQEVDFEREDELRESREAMARVEGVVRAAHQDVEREAKEAWRAGEGLLQWRALAGKRQQEVEELQQKLDEVQEELRATRESESWVLAREAHQADQARERIGTLEQGEAHLGSLCQEYEAKIETLAGLKEAYLTRITYLEQANLSLAGEVTRRLEQVAAMGEEADRVRACHAETLAQHDDQEEHLRAQLQLETDTRLAGGEKIDDLRGRLDRAGRHRCRQEFELDQARQEIKQLKAADHQAAQAIRRLTEERDALIDHRDEKVDLLHSALEQRDDLERQRDVESRWSRVLARQLDEARDKMAEEVEDLQARLDRSSDAGRRLQAQAGVEGRRACALETDLSSERELHSRTELQLRNVEAAAQDLVEQRDGAVAEVAELQGWLDGERAARAKEGQLLTRHLAKRLEKAGRERNDLERQLAELQAARAETDRNLQISRAAVRAQRSTIERKDEALQLCRDARTAKEEELEVALQRGETVRLGDATVALPPLRDHHQLLDQEREDRELALPPEPRGGRCSMPGPVPPHAHLGSGERIDYRRRTWRKGVED